jgi:hypothetical protein
MKNHQILRNKKVYLSILMIVSSSIEEVLSDPTEGEDLPDPEVQKGSSTVKKTRKRKATSADTQPRSKILKSAHDGMADLTNEVSAEPHTCVSQNMNML